MVEEIEWEEGDTTEEDDEDTLVGGTSPQEVQRSSLSWGGLKKARSGPA